VTNITTAKPGCGRYGPCLLSFQSWKPEGLFSWQNKQPRLAHLKCDPTDATPPFNLGNPLRSNGRRVEAEAALRAATRADAMFAEAWYNLSDLLDEQGGRKPPSIACARRYEPRRPTLMRYSISRSCFNEATSTRKLRNTGGNYIANDAQSEWAARARRSLKFCEMQIHLSAYFWEARSSCGKQPVCQRRHDACIETGCWTVGLIKRCGYEKR
jgi:hypothetical protein